MGRSRQQCCLAWPVGVLVFALSVHTSAELEHAGTIIAHGLEINYCTTMKEIVFQILRSDGL